jgi:predicted transposase/invertase (TIGR01784 family)
LDSFNDIPSILREPVFEKAFNTAEYLMYSPKIQETYQNDLKAYRDNRNAFITAHSNGRTEGKIEGRTERQNEFIVNLNQMGFDIETIAKAANLSIDEIKKILK